MLAKLLHIAKVLVVTCLIFFPAWSEGKLVDVSINGVSWFDTKESIADRDDFTYYPARNGYGNFISNQQTCVNFYYDEIRAILGPRVKVGEKLVSEGMLESDCLSLLGEPIEALNSKHRNGANFFDRALRYRGDGFFLIVELKFFWIQGRDALRVMHFTISDRKEWEFLRACYRDNQERFILCCSPKLE